MFNLYQILLAAQGGQALDNLASRFGLSREQADSAVKALIPALSTAFMTKAMHPGGMQEIAGAMTDDQHRQAYADPGVAAAPETRQKGSDVASSVFGSDSLVSTVVREASRYTGIPEATLQQMLPVVISMVLGGVATAMHGQGMGGILGQLANSGLGNIFGQGAAGGAGGVLGSILGGMFGGGGSGQPAAPEPAPQPAPAPQTPPPAPGFPGSGFPGGAFPGGGSGFPASMQDIFGKMFQPGVDMPGGQLSNLGAEISSILSGKR